MNYKEQGIATRTRMIAFIRDYHNKYGYMPLYKEIGDGVGLSSKNTIWNQMERLYKDGIIESDHKGSPRAYRFNYTYMWKNN